MPGVTQARDHPTTISPTWSRGQAETPKSERRWPKGRPNRTRRRLPPKLTMASHRLRNKPTAASAETT